MSRRLGDKEGKQGGGTYVPSVFDHEEDCELTRRESVRVRVRRATAAKEVTHLPCHGNERGEWHLIRLHSYRSC